jgi:glycosyltransferase involved in cell wall biosynthesis
VTEDGVTGTLVPHGDAALLSSAVQSLLTDPARAREMGERGRERVRADVAFERFQSRLTQVLQDVATWKP